MRSLSLIRSFRNYNHLGIIVGSFLMVYGCGGGQPSNQEPPAQGAAISPSSASVLLGNMQQFTASGASPWAVNGILGGNSTVGTISSSGLYMAPTVLPANVTVSISASGTSGSAAVTITSDIAVSVSSNSAGTDILTSSQASLSAMVTSSGKPNTSVQWSVTGGGNLTQTGTDAANYVAPAQQPTTSIQITATSVADPSKSGILTLTVTGILLPSFQAAPGSTLPITGNFNASEATNVVFSDAGSYNLSVAVTPSSASSVSVRVPFYVTSAGASSGVVTVSVIQMASNVPTTIGSVGGFQIQNLSPGQGALGIATLAVLADIGSINQDAKYNWDLIGTASQGSVSVAMFDSDSQTTLGGVNSLMQAVYSVASGGPPVTLATGNLSLQLDATSLGFLDAIFQNYIINNNDLQTAPLLRSAQQHAKLMRTKANLVNLTPLLNLLSDVSGDVLTLYPLLLVESPVAVGAAIVVATAALALMAGQITADILAAATENNNDNPSLLNQIEQGLSNAVITATNDINALGTNFNIIISDLVNDLGTELTDTEAIVSQAEQNESTIVSNLPTPPNSNATPQIQLSSPWVSSAGSAEVEVQVTNAPPNATYVVQTSWGATQSITTASWGNDWTYFFTPDLQGACQNFTFSLTTSQGTVASASGCFGGTQVTDFRQAVIAYSSGLNPVTIPWNPPFPDTNYTVACTAETILSDFLLPVVVSKSGASTTVLPTDDDDRGTLDCIAIPDSDTSDIRHNRVTFVAPPLPSLPPPVVVSWTPMFADTNYTVVCTLESAATQEFSSVVNTLSPGSVTVINGGAARGTMDCIAVPDSDTNNIGRSRVAVSGNPSTVAIPWNPGFGNANYAAVCTDQESGVSSSDSAIAISAGSKTAISLAVIPEIPTGTVHCIGVPSPMAQ